MLKGKPAGESDVVTMHAIKCILADYENTAETAAAPARRLRTPVAEESPTLQPVREVQAKVNLAKFTAVPTGAELTPDTQAEAARSAKRARKAPKLPKVLRRITPRMAAIALMFGLAIFKPGILIFGLLAVFAVVLGTFVLFGADRVWSGVSRRLAAFEKRNPKRAARLMDRLDAFAVKWDGFLDRFPEGWVDGLYLPDFANYHYEQEAREARLDDRLTRMHSQV